MVSQDVYDGGHCGQDVVKWWSLWTGCCHDGGHRDRKLSFGGHCGQDVVMMVVIVDRMLSRWWSLWTGCCHDGGLCGQDVVMMMVIVDRMLS